MPNFKVIVSNDIQGYHQRQKKHEGNNDDNVLTSFHFTLQNIPVCVCVIDRQMKYEEQDAPKYL